MCCVVWQVNGLIEGLLMEAPLMLKAFPWKPLTFGGVSDWKFLVSDLKLGLP